MSVFDWIANSETTPSTPYIEGFLKEKRCRVYSVERRHRVYQGLIDGLIQKSF